MPESPKQVLEKIESIKGRKLVLYLIPLFILFIFIGILVGNIIPGLLKKDEAPVEIPPTPSTEVKSTQYSGKVVYIDPNFYPHDNISFYLEDEQGEEIILLTASDQKLTVVEGLNVIVFGKLEKTMDGENDVLNVEKVVVRN